MDSEPPIKSPAMQTEGRPMDRLARAREAPPLPDAFYVKAVGWGFQHGGQPLSREV